MHAIDHAVLMLCREDFRPLKALGAQIPRGSLYRHVNRLVELGWLERTRSLYRATAAGQRQLADAQRGQRWTRMEQLCPALKLVPTDVHRAMIVLIFAAVVCRQHHTRPDRHPYFGCVGGTLLWKTSLGHFVCHALGLDPSQHVVECGSETGKSLGVRRTGAGEIVFKRELLDAPFLVLDEFQSADRNVRATLGRFLSGRLVVPAENEELTIHPVPLVTLNPQNKPTLEGRLGLSAARIRRGIFANLDAVAMPDLAAMGERAVAAVRQQAPLVIPAPASDCEPFRKPIVTLFRDIVKVEAAERVDVEVMLNLCGGMNGWISDPAEAIVQVGYALGLLAETMGWTNPGWIEAINDFSLDENGRRSTRALEKVPRGERGEPAGGAALPPGSGARSSLSVELPKIPRETGAPNLAVSDELRDWLIWFAVQTGRSLEEGLWVLLKSYMAWSRDPDVFAKLRKSLTLARDLKLAQVDIDTLHGYVEARAMLAQYDCSFEDIPWALLRMVKHLESVPVAWDWPMVGKIVAAVAMMMRAEIGLEEIRAFLIRHRYFRELGFDDRTAEAVVEALANAGATGERRGRVLRQLIPLASQRADLEDLKVERHRLEQEIAALNEHRHRLEVALQEGRARLAQLAREEVDTQARKDQVDAACTVQAADLEVVRAIRGVLLGKSAFVEALWADLEKLQVMRRTGVAADGVFATVLVGQLQQKLVDFMKRLIAEAACA